MSTGRNALAKDVVVDVHVHVVVDVDGFERIRLRCGPIEESASVKPHAPRGDTSYPIMLSRFPATLGAYITVITEGSTKLVECPVVYRYRRTIPIYNPHSSPSWDTTRGRFILLAQPIRGFALAGSSRGKMQRKECVYKRRR